MLTKTRAIILRSFPYGETSLIVEAYTEELGLRRYIINGVRKQKAQVPQSLLQVMSLVEMVVYEREGKDLQRTREIRPAYVYQQLPFDLRRGSVGLFIIEVVRKALREGEAQPALFHYLYQLLIELDQTQQAVGQLPLVFMVRFMLYLGIRPAGKYSADTPVFDLEEGMFVAQPPATHHNYWQPPVSTALSQLLHAQSPHDIQLLHRKQLLRLLIQYYQYHIDYLGTIHTHQVLEEVFS